VSASELSKRPRYERTAEGMDDTAEWVTGHRADRSMPTAQGTDLRSGTSDPGVSRAPVPAAAHGCGTWQPRWGPASGQKANRKGG
jgi:hypothetical protein